VAAARVLPLLAALHLLQRVLADRLQHPESRLFLRLLHRHKGLLHQAAVEFQDLPGNRSVPRADRLGRLKRPAAGEDGQPPEEGLLARAEQVVAPGERVAHGALAAGQVARPINQQRQRAVQAGQQRRGWQELRPRRRQRSPTTTGSGGTALMAAPPAGQAVGTTGKGDRAGTVSSRHAGPVRGYLGR
jgi:hypothetical protein